jgi:hypothetical protein
MFSGASMRHYRLLAKSLGTENFRSRLKDRIKSELGVGKVEAELCLRGIRAIATRQDYEAEEELGMRSDDEENVMTIAVDWARNQLRDSQPQAGMLKNMIHNARQRDLVKDLKEQILEARVEQYNIERKREKEEEEDEEKELPQKLHPLVEAILWDPQEMERLREIADMRDQHELYPLARLLKRKIHLHTGPTNSGKTYRAIEELKLAKTGIYCAPLRLLAWEVYEKLNAAGIPCNLRTGQEKIDVPDARHTACTVEMASCVRFLYLFTEFNLDLEFLL